MQSSVQSFVGTWQCVKRFFCIPCSMFPGLLVGGSSDYGLTIVL